MARDARAQPLYRGWIFRGWATLRALSKAHGYFCACLDSCSVGIISNHTYTHGAVEKRGEVVFHGNKDVLPPDGTFVAISFRVAN
ncbi:hypothetical protein [Campylobacter concisus]|uniref:hypothetical protein n=1 Tax=Campylobacter concisus TaxID=199 RepID=UPI00122C7FAE|nr:hypothetical protein [Campylobacter concisus]